MDPLQWVLLFLCLTPGNRQTKKYEHFECVPTQRIVIYGVAAQVISELACTQPRIVYINLSATRILPFLLPAFLGTGGGWMISIVIYKVRKTLETRNIFMHTLFLKEFLYSFKGSKLPTGVFPIRLQYTFFVTSKVQYFTNPMKFLNCTNRVNNMKSPHFWTKLPTGFLL